MLQKIQNFFLDLRQKDETAKKRWLMILSSGTMLIIIPLWIVYINLTVRGLNEKEKNNNGPGFMETMKNGLEITSKEVGSKFSELMASLQELANQTNSITIQGASPATNKNK
ncbi:MAG: hypothetical protein HZB99_04510 [Candidatus Harrisonbacteria bacterium]|nr:hypothetical protein [Candidatus Harrisonbacteria bacterium]